MPEASRCGLSGRRSALRRNGDRACPRRISHEMPILRSTIKLRGVFSESQPAVSHCSSEDPARAPYLRLTGADRRHAIVAYR